MSPLLCGTRAFIQYMEARGFVPIPHRRLTRALKREGAPVFHGPVSISRTGNWIPRLYLESLLEHRQQPAFRKLPFHLQVAAVVWWVKKGMTPATPHASL